VSKATATAWAVSVPGTLHPQVAAQGQAVVEADEQMLAACLDARDRCADQPRQIRHPAQSGLRLRAGIRDAPADERGPQDLGNAKDRVAFGHACIVAGRPSKPPVRDR
jgi:hypothetical protein